MRTPLYLAALTAAPAALAQPAPDAKPNVIYIIMDDLGYGELGCYGQQKIETPHIDQLAREGLRFTQHYTGCPVSAPARCTLMTGLHSGNAQIRGNDEMPARGETGSHEAMFRNPYLEGQYPLAHGTPTLPGMMRAAGYATGVFGKWGLGYPGSDGTPNKQGVDEFYGYNCQRQAHNHYPPFLYHNEAREYLDNPVIDPHRQRVPADSARIDAAYARFTQKQYAHDLIYDALARFIDARAGQQPLFIMWTTPLPHVSLQAPKRWVDYYVKKFGDEKPKPEAGYLPCRYPHATYAAMVSYFDEQVGQLVALLKAKGLYDNTLIFFTSDNGPTFNGGTDSPWFNSGGPFRSEYGWGKCFVHEGGVRVPAIAVWPGHVKADTQTDHICTFPDMMPTLAELAGTPCPHTDGLSFLPTLLGQQQRQHHAHLYWEYAAPDNPQRALRWGKWKAIQQHLQRADTHIELYDLEADLREEHDVAAQHPDIVAHMRAIMDAEHRQPDNPTFDIFRK